MSERAEDVLLLYTEVLPSDEEAARFSAAKTYVETLEDLLQHEIQFISVGAERSQYLTKGEWL